MKERRESEGDSSELSASILDPYHVFAMQRLLPCDQSFAHKEHNGADCAAALRSHFTTKVTLTSRLEKTSNWKKRKETNLVLFHLSGDFCVSVGALTKTTLKSARVSIPTPKEEGKKWKARGAKIKCTVTGSPRYHPNTMWTHWQRHQNGASVMAAAAVRIQSSTHRDVESLDTCTRTMELCGFSLSSTQ